MKKKKHEPARQVSAEEIKLPQANKKLIDQTYFKIDKNGKVTYSKKTFDQTD
ncbi:MAG: hypothetical protein LBT06_11190 [Hungatella sp.]|jgi:hypothetical protein|nr:hypothetical protein [Hungatella sp.]